MVVGGRGVAGVEGGRVVILAAVAVRGMTMLGCLCWRVSFLFDFA